MILQLNPPLPVVCPKGKAVAHFLIDSGSESDLLWVCFLDVSGECWTYNNKMIRAQRNMTLGRENISPFYDPDDVALSKLKPITCLSCDGTDFEDQIIQSFINVDGIVELFTHETMVCQDCGATLMTSDQIDALLKMYGERNKE